jgi:hypothetical protein
VRPGNQKFYVIDGTSLQLQELIPSESLKQRALHEPERRAVEHSGLC